MSSHQAAPRTNSRPPWRGRLQNTLARLGGGLPSGSIGTGRRDRITTQMVGLVSVVTSVLVLTVFTWTFTVMFDIPWYFALVLAAPLGFAILGVNCVLVDSLVTPRSMRAKAGIVLLGLVSAAFVGVIPASAVSLVVVTSSLDDARKATVRQKYADISGLERKEEQLVAAIAMPYRPDVDATPEVRRLKQEFAAKDTEVKAAEQARFCERTGRCGSPQGRGEGYRELNDTVSRLLSERNDLEGRLTTARKAAQTAVDNAVRQQQTRDGTELTDIRKRLEKLRTDYANAIDEIDANKHSRDAQRDRLGALAGLLMTWGPAWLAFAVAAASYVVLHTAAVVLKFVCGTSPADAAAYGANFTAPTLNESGGPEHEARSTEQQVEAAFSVRQRNTSPQPQESS